MNSTTRSQISWLKGKGMISTTRPLVALQNVTFESVFKHGRIYSLAIQKWHLQNLDLWTCLSGIVISLAFTFLGGESRWRRKWKTALLCAHLKLPDAFFFSFGPTTSWRICLIWINVGNGSQTNFQNSRTPKHIILVRRNPTQGHHVRIVGWGAPRSCRMRQRSGFVLIYRFSLDGWVVVIAPGNESGIILIPSENQVIRYIAKCVFHSFALW